MRCWHHAIITVFAASVIATAVQADPMPASAFTYRVVAGNFDHSGNTDIAAVFGKSDNTGDFYIWRSSCTGGVCAFVQTANLFTGAVSEVTEMTARIVSGRLPPDRSDDTIVALADQSAGGPAASAIFGWDSVCLAGYCGINWHYELWSAANYNGNAVVGRVVVGDFDGQYGDDVAVVFDYGSCESRIHVWLQDIDGDDLNYQGSSGWWSSGAYCAQDIKHRVVAGDFNNDGKDDLAALRDMGTDQNGKWLARADVWLSSGSSFTLSNWWPGSGNITGYNTNKIAGRVVAGQFNGAGGEDIAALYEYPNGETRIHVWTSAGTAFQYSNSSGWWSSTGYNAAKVTGRVVSGQFDGTGCDDIAAIYEYPNSESRIHVWTNSNCGKPLGYSGSAGWWQSN